MNRHLVTVALAPEEAAAALARAAAEWGAEWEGDERGGRLVLPVVFGLRRGVLVGRVEIAREGGKSRLTWQIEESHLEVQRAAVGVLAGAAIVLVPALAWPFHPPLMALLPFAAVIGLLAYWLVLSRLRTSGPEEFFATLQPAEPGMPPPG